MDKRALLEQAEVRAKNLGRHLHAQMPEGWGFALILFSFGEGGFSTYISDANRADMIAALKECIEKLESRSEI